MSKPVAIRRRADVSIALLVLGAIAYAVLCLCAMERRSDELEDGFWKGASYLWLAPLCLSALFDGWTFLSRYWHLVIYALVTAFFDAGTTPLVMASSSRSLVIAEMIAGTLTFVGPFHLVVTLIVETVMQCLLGRFRTFEPPRAGEAFSLIPRIPLSVWLIGHTVICLAIGLPFACRELAYARFQEIGRRRADEHWKDGAALMLNQTSHNTHEREGVTFEYDVDRHSGLFLKKDYFGNRRFCVGYEKRIRELLNEHGRPDWGLSDEIPSVETLAALLDSTELSEVEWMPFHVTPNITLLRDPGAASFSIAAAQRWRTPSTVKQRVYVGRVGDQFVVRDGALWVGVFLRDGRLIASASRYSSKDRRRGQLDELVHPQRSLARNRPGDDLE